MTIKQFCKLMSRLKTCSSFYSHKVLALSSASNLSNLKFPVTKYLALTRGGGMLLTVPTLAPPTINPVGTQIDIVLTVNPYDTYATSAILLLPFSDPFQVTL